LSRELTDDQFNQYRLESTLLRVVRDANPDNDVRGIVVAWDDQHVLIRKRGSKNLLKLDRRYVYQPYSEKRAMPTQLDDQAHGSIDN
jgi:hypothetical protein